MYYIYALVNTTNNKIYVGQTTNLKRRLSRHKHEAFVKNDKRPLYNAIRKHGLEKFDFIEIESHKSENEINDAEEFWIEFLQSHISKNGYNIDYGRFKRGVVSGAAVAGWKHSEKTKSEMSKNRKGTKNPFYGKKHTKEAKAKMSTNPNRKYFGKSNPFHKIKFQGSNHPRSKLTEEMVISARKEYSKGITYKDLSKKYNVSETTISRAVRGISWSHVK